MTFEHNFDEMHCADLHRDNEINHGFQYSYCTTFSCLAFSVPSMSTTTLYTTDMQHELLVLLALLLVA